MRVLCIGLDHRVAVAGAEGHAATWSQEIANRLERYVVIVEDATGKLPAKLALSHNVTVYAVSGSRLAFPFRVAQLARQLHATYRFDLCTVEDPFRAGYAGLLFNRATGTALNVENHTLMINNPEWLRSRWINRLYNRLGKRVLRAADSIRNYSGDQLLPLLEIGVSRKRIFTIAPPVKIYPGVQGSACRQKLGIREDDIVFLAAGRMVAIKNIPCVLQAFSLLKNRRAHLVLAGDGPERPRWRKEAAALPLQDRVHWMGRVPEEAMAELYAASDIFVTASFHETGPRTILEAFSASKPAIGTPGMGVVRSGILESSKTGLVAEPSAVPFSSAMRILAESPELRAEMGMEGRKRVEEMHSYRTIAEQVFESWQHTMGDSTEIERFDGQAVLSS